MSTTRVWQSIGVFVLGIALIIGLSLYNPNQKSLSEVSQEQEQTMSISLTIEGLYQNKVISALEDETMLRMLQALNSQDPQLQLSTKEYTGLGTLVEGMGALKNGVENKYWQYKVQGVMPQVGADVYQLKDGDVVEWFFETSEF